MEENKNEEVIAYIKFYSEIKKVILTPTFEELKKKICNVMQINEDLFNSLKLNYKDVDNDIITVSSEEDYNILLAQIKNKEVDILNIESEQDANIDIDACSHSILKFHENIDKEEKEEKKNNFDIISSQQFEIKEEKKDNQKNNNVIESIQSNRIEITENNQNQLNKKNNLNIQNDDDYLQSPYIQNDINDNGLKENHINFNNNNINNFNNNKINNINNLNNINNINNINNNINNNNLGSQTYMVFPYNCNLCNQYPIVKVLYYCPVCNIPLCEECEEKLGINHRHSILKVQTNQQFDDLNLKINADSNRGNENSNNNNNNNNNKSNENQSQIMNFVNNIKDSLLSGIFRNDNKNQNVNNVNQGLNNRNQQMVPQQMSLIQIARAQYDLNGINDNQLQEALDKTNGNIDEAVVLLMQ